MNEIERINTTHAAHSIARSYGYNNLQHSVFVCKDNDACKKYFSNKKKLNQEDIKNVYYELFNKFVSTTDELNSLAKKECVHRSQLDEMLENIRKAYLEYDDFAIIEFNADYPRCRECGEIILEESKSLGNTCSKCDCKVFSRIIRRCGVPAIQDILSIVDVDINSSIEDMLDIILRDKRICSALIERYNKLLKEKKLKPV